MNRRHALAAGGSPAVAGHAAAQPSWPDRPVTIVVAKDLGARGRGDRAPGLTHPQHALGPAGGGAEHRRRERHDRDGSRGAGGAGRPHHAAHRQHPDRDSRVHEPAPTRDAASLLDQARWHLPDQIEVLGNIPPLPLRPTCRELDMMETLWPFIRDNRLSNRVVLDAGAIADQPRRIMTNGVRDWSHGSW